MNSLAWVLALIHLASTQTFNNTKSLRSDLLSEYVTTLRPGSDQSVALNVSVGLNMVLLKEYNEVTSSFTFVGYMTVMWTDHRLVWTPTLNGNLTTAVLIQTEIWVPPFLVYNPTETYSLIGFNQDRVRISSDGSVLWMPPEVFHFICEADVTYFPFDRQSCTLGLRLCGHQTTDVNIQHLHDAIQFVTFEQNGIWKITSSSTSIKTMMNFQFVQFSVSMVRRSAFYVVNLLLPMLAMLVLQIFVFVLPAESGERIGYSITVLLATSVFLSMVCAFLPTTVIPSIPIISFKLLVEFIICC